MLDKIIVRFLRISLLAKGKKKFGLLCTCSLFLLVMLLTACAKQYIGSYKVVLVQDSSLKSLSPEEKVKIPAVVQEANFLIGQQKAARLAIERFNAETDINNLALELEILDLALTKIHTTIDLQGYINQLQRRTFHDVSQKQQHSVVVGFVMGQNDSPALLKFRELVKGKGQVLVGSWTGASTNLPNTQDSDVLVLNIANPLFEANEYLLKYIVEKRNLEALYVVHDSSHSKQAEDFLLRSRTEGLNDLVSLEYIDGNSNYDEGTIQGLADLLRNLRTRVLSEKKRYGIVLFLTPKYVNRVNSYLAESPYQYLFDNLDFILSGDGLTLAEFDWADSPLYFALQELQDEAQKKNYQSFLNQYQKSYHLSIERSSLEVFDAVNLLAHTAKKTIESTETELNLPVQLYQNLLKTQFDGATGRILFDAKGKRSANYVVFRLNNKKIERVGYFLASKNQFVAD